MEKFAEDGVLLNKPDSLPFVGVHDASAAATLGHCNGKGSPSENLSLGICFLLIQIVVIATSLLSAAPSQREHLAEEKIQTLGTGRFEHWGLRARDLRQKKILPERNFCLSEMAPLRFPRLEFQGRGQMALSARIIQTKAPQSRKQDCFLLLLEEEFLNWTQCKLPRQSFVRMRIPAAEFW